MEDLSFSNSWWVFAFHIKLKNREQPFAKAVSPHRIHRTVLADANFPTSSVCRSGPTEIRVDGLKIPELLKAILKLFPLDTYVSFPAAVMALVHEDEVKGLQTPVWDKFMELLSSVGFEKKLEVIERFEFYERAKNSFAVVATGETALYGNLILRKGVIPAGENGD